MRIVQIIPHYIPATRYGGPQRVAHSIGKCFVKMGHEVIVCTTNLKDEVSNLDVPNNKAVELDGVKVYYCPTLMSRYWGFSPSLSKRIATEVKNADFVLIHAHYQFANFIGAWISRNLRKPYVIFAHGSLHRSGIAHKKLHLKKIYLRVFEHKNMSLAKFIAFNAFEEKESSLYNDCGKVIHNGINPEEFLLLPPKGYFRSLFTKLGANPFFLFLGRLDIQQKGLDLLVSAFAKFSRRYPNINLVIAGPDEDNGLAKIKALIKEFKLAETIHFTGLIEGKIKLAALQDADAFILPSRFEGLSIALLEALFMGLPVLVTNQVGLHSEISQEKAGLVVDCDVESIASGLLQLADHNTRFAMKGIGKNIILQHYTWDAITKDLISKLLG